MPPQVGEGAAGGSAQGEKHGWWRRPRWIRICHSEGDGDHHHRSWREVIRVRERDFRAHWRHGDTHYWPGRGCEDPECTEDGQACSDDAQCCGSSVCQGVCCIGEGSPCGEGGAGCCEGLACDASGDTPTCVNVEPPPPPPPPPDGGQCVPAQGSCGAGGTCCLGLTCGGSGLCCIDGNAEQIVDCVTDADCCNGAICDLGGCSAR